MTPQTTAAAGIWASPWRLLVALALPIAVLDQITKAAVREILPLHESWTVIPGLLDFTHVRNTGAAFGLLNAVEFPYKPQVMMIVALVALVAIAAFAARLHPHERLARAGLALILGGAVGNLIDRALHGYVLDFVDVYHRGLHFWAFNVADAAISIGAALVLIEVLFTGHRHVPTAV
jgi:signal peptidase II